MFSPDEFPPLDHQETSSIRVKQHKRRVKQRKRRVKQHKRHADITRSSRTATKAKAREEQERQDHASREQARQYQEEKTLVKKAYTEIENLKANLAHAMIMAAIRANDIVMLVILFNNEMRDTTFLTLYLIHATFHSVACIREVMRHMRPVRDGRVIYYVLGARHVPLDCFEELMRTVAPNMSQQQFLNIVARRSSSIRAHDFKSVIIRHLRTFTDRRKFPSSICHHLFDGCELFTNKFERYGARAQHVSCDNCVTEASAIWNREQADWLLEELKSVVLVDLIYEFSADFTRLGDKLPSTIWEIIRQFSDCDIIYGPHVNQVGYQVSREEPREIYWVRMKQQWKPIAGDIDDYKINPSGDFHESAPDGSESYSPINTFTNQAVKLSISRDYYDKDLVYNSYIHFDHAYVSEYRLVDIVGWKKSGTSDVKN